MATDRHRWPSPFDVFLVTVVVALCIGIAVYSGVSWWAGLLLATTILAYGWSGAPRLAVPAQDEGRADGPEGQAETNEADHQ